MDTQPVLFPQPPRYPAGRRETRFGFAVLLCSVFTWNAIMYGGFNLGFALGSLAATGCTVWYLIGGGYRLDRYSGALLVLAGIIAAGFARSSDGFVKFVMVLFFLLAVNVSFCLISGQNRRDPGRIGSVLDGPRAFFVLGVGGLGASARGLNDARKEAEAAGKKGGAVLLGAIIALPVVLVTTFLLMRADAAFEGLMDLMPDLDWSEPFASVVVGGFAGWIVYARGVGLRCAPKKAPKACRSRGIPCVTVNVLLGAVNLIYCVYLLSQFAYVGGGFSGILPQGYTLAEYARRGFFEMAWLSVINLGLMCFSMALVEKQARQIRLTRGFCVALGAVTLVLVATASAKMLLYIGSYGLTRLRVLTEVIMVWLAITAVLVVIWLFRPGFPYMKGVILTALVLGALVFWVDVDTQVARYNVRSYREGRMETIDMRHMANLGCGAVPYLVELTRDEDPLVAEEAGDILRWKYAHIADFRDWNYSEAAAAKILEKDVGRETGGK